MVARKAAEESHTYSHNRVDLIPNLGEGAQRRGDLDGYRGVDGQPRNQQEDVGDSKWWSRRRAHLLLQVRTRELNGELRNTSAGWSQVGFGSWSNAKDTA